MKFKISFKMLHSLLMHTTKPRNNQCLVPHQCTMIFKACRSLRAETPSLMIGWPGGDTLNALTISEIWQAKLMECTYIHV